MKQLRDRSPAILISAFFAPVILLILVLMNLHVTPFGEGTFLRADMNSQYSAFLTYLRSILLGENDLFYSFSMNGGGNFYFLYTYYLANPFNWLMALVPAEDIPQALTFFILIRLGLAGLTMSLYLRRIRPSSFGWGTLLFSTSYALMTYTLVCAENYFFIDGVVMLPLVLIGIEDIFERKSFLGYALALGFMLLIQFYIGWMICIFAVLYFLFRILNRSGNGKRSNRGALRRFIAGSLLAALCASIILVPVAAGLSALPKDTNIPWTQKISNFSFFSLLGKNLPGAYDTMEFRYGLPGIYSGALITVYFLHYLAADAVTRKERLLTAGMLLFLWISFWSYGLNRVWHGFAEPVWWPYRYSFLFSFWLIRAAALRFPTDERAPSGKRLLLSGILAVACWLPLLTGFHLASLRLTLIESAFLLFFMLAETLRGKLGRAFLPAVSVVVLMNLYLHASTILGPNLTDPNPAEPYRERIRAFSALLDPVAKGRTDLFRIENLDIRDSNDPMRLGYQGLTHYSSTVSYADYLFPLRIFGVPQRHYWTTVTEGVPAATLSLFGIEATLKSATEISMNPNALPIAFSAPSSIIRSVIFTHLPYENLNAAFKAISGKDFGPIYEAVESEKTPESDGETIWNFRPRQIAPVYMYVENQEIEPNLIESAAGPQTIQVFPDESYLLGTIQQGENVRVTSHPDPNSADPAGNRVFYSESLDVLGRYAGIIQPRGVTVEKIRPSQLRARYTGNAETPYLFFSILYDEGWKAYVDGEERLLIPALNYFMMIQADPGTHVVELRYTPPGFRTGAALSFAGIALLLIAAFMERKKSEPMDPKADGFV